MMKKLLNLKEIYEVYQYLEKGLETVGANTSVDDFAMALLEVLKETPEHYFRILQLFTGMKDEKILSLTAQDALVYFLEGLKTNQILRFRSFMQELSTDYGPY